MDTNNQTVSELSNDAPVSEYKIPTYVCNNDHYIELLANLIEEIPTDYRLRKELISKLINDCTSGIKFRCINNKAYSHEVDGLYVPYYPITSPKPEDLKDKVCTIESFNNDIRNVVANHKRPMMKPIDVPECEFTSWNRLEDTIRQRVIDKIKGTPWEIIDVRNKDLPNYNVCQSAMYMSTHCITNLFKLKPESEEYGYYNRLLEKLTFINDGVHKLEHRMDFLDKYAPYWNKIEGLMITGSFALAMHPEYHEKGKSKLYSPTRYDLKPLHDEYTELGMKSVKSHETIKTLVVYLPHGKVDGYYKKQICSKDVYKNFKLDDIVVPEITKPTALIEWSTRLTPIEGGTVEPLISVLKFVDILPNVDIDVPVTPDMDIEDTARTIYRECKQLGNVSISINCANERKPVYQIKIEPCVPYGSTQEEAEKFIMEYLTFYPVEVYPVETKWRMFTHHVPCTRNWMECKDNKPVFFSSGDFLLCNRFYYMDNYNYFAGVKSQPMDVICRYSARGFRIGDEIGGSIPMLQKYIYDNRLAYKQEGFSISELDMKMI